jgi:hypothetical protein
MARPPASPSPVPTDPPPADGVLRHLGIDGCVRLPIVADAATISAELDALPADAWGQASRDPVVQASVDSFFAIGYPRGPRPLPADDRPVLAHLPYLRRLLRETVAATPTRAIVARLRPYGLIPIHRDTPRFFRGTVRLSIQVSAAGVQRLFCNGRWYDQAPGEVWALDNLTPHAVRNAAAEPRINVLVDYRPSPDLLRLLAEAEAGLGVHDDAATQEIESLSRERFRRYRWRGIRYEIFKRLWRRRV